MKTIRNFLCDTEPFNLAIGGLLILLFGGMGIYSIYTGEFLEYLSVVGMSVGFSILMMIVFFGSIAIIAWAQSFCKEE